MTIMIAVEEDKILEIENLVDGLKDGAISDRLSVDLDCIKHIINDMMVSGRNATQWCRYQDKKDEATTLELVKQYKRLPRTQKEVFEKAMKEN